MTPRSSQSVRDMSNKIPLPIVLLPILDSSYNNLKLSSSFCLSYLKIIALRAGVWHRVGTQ